MLPILQQSPVVSYSFRNGDMGFRFWGAGHEGEEKEDNSDSDEEQDMYQNKFFNAVKGFLHAVFPNAYPLFWLFIPFAVSAVLAAASYGDNNDAGNEGIIIFSKETRFDTENATEDPQTTFVRL